MLIRTLLALATLLMATSAAAHPGHGDPGQAHGLLHYLTEPIHVLGALVVAFAGISGAGALRRRPLALRERRRSR